MSIYKLGSNGDRMINEFAEVGGMRIGGVIRSAGIKPGSVPLCPPLISYDF
jgi:hypothetical protein